MIAYFPEIYPDELLYSQLARYYQKSGYIALISVMEDLYVRSTVRADIEFLNSFTDEAISMITKQMSMEEIVLKHTMFPYYGRFIKKDRRVKAFAAMVAMDKEYLNLLPRRKRNDCRKRYLRYCTVCAKDDRQRYGETYWHRTHQMIGIKVCPVHGCYLNETSVLISSKTSPMLINAEEIITDEEGIIYPEKPLELCIARYMAEVFQMEIELDCDVTIGKFLHSKLENTKYVSLRGKKRNMALLHKDFMEMYGALPDNDFTELWQIHKVLTDDRPNFYEVCLLAMFLGIEATEFGEMKLPEKSQEQLFDEKIHELHEQGLKYPEIAKLLNASYDLVKPIGENNYGAYHYYKDNPRKGGTKSKDWTEADKNALPLVKEAIMRLQGDGISRPKKICVNAVARMLGLNPKNIKYMPKCKAEIELHMESQEQYWAREVIWAAEKILREGKTLNVTQIMKLTNMKKKDFIMCVPFVKDYAEHEIVESVQSIIDDLVRGEKANEGIRFI